MMTAKPKLVVVNAETWKPTMNLRWYQKQFAIGGQTWLNSPVLQQQYVLASDRLKFQWRMINLVLENDK